MGCRFALHLFVQRLYLAGLNALDITVQVQYSIIQLL